MTKREFEKLCGEIVEKLRKLAPYRTGNLANNGVTFEFSDDNTCNIYVDEAIAPYMPFTNEKWISPKWNGKQNPNEMWWQKSIEKIVDEIAVEYDGELEKKGDL